jgi:phosphonopyruvate decarboxylase
MLDPIDFINKCRQLGVGFFSGVPDSSMKSLCNAICNELDSRMHVISVNEGAAVSLASGVHLGSNLVPLVYFQNSGQGNSLNPLISLASKEVFSIPMIMLVGWRGKPGSVDEPQHSLQGKVTKKIFEEIGIKVIHLSSKEEMANSQLEEALSVAIEISSPVCILVENGTFSDCNLETSRGRESLPRREDALERVLLSAKNRTVFISTTGKTSREVFEIRGRLGQAHERDFLVVGSMGHCSFISVGLAMARPDVEVICIDGDGSVLMHMGSLPTIAELGCKNLTHVIVNNGVHESVGGHQTTSPDLDFSKVARSCGYRESRRVSNLEDLVETLQDWEKMDGPKLIEIMTRPGSRKDLGRPGKTPLEVKDSFMRFLQND